MFSFNSSYSPCFASHRTTKSIRHNLTLWQQWKGKSTKNTIHKFGQPPTEWPCGKIENEQEEEEENIRKIHRDNTQTICHMHWILATKRTGNHFKIKAPIHLTTQLMMLGHSPTTNGMKQTPKRRKRTNENAQRTRVSCLDNKWYVILIMAVLYVALSRVCSDTVLAPSQISLPGDLTELMECLK